MFHVFITSSGPSDLITQDLKRTFSRYGITTVISTELFSPGVNYQELITYQVKQCDCILAVIENSGVMRKTIDYELSMAISLNKIVVPFIERGASIPSSIGQKPFIIFDRMNPKQSYDHVGLYLNKLKMEKENKNSLGAILLLGLGIILLGALASSDK